MKLKRKRGEECEREILLLLLFTLGAAVDCSRRKSFRRHEVLAGFQRRRSKTKELNEDKEREGEK